VCCCRSDVLLTPPGIQESFCFMGRGGAFRSLFPHPLYRWYFAMERLQGHFFCSPCTFYELGLISDGFPCPRPTTLLEPVGAGALGVSDTHYV